MIDKEGFTPIEMAMRLYAILPPAARPDFEAQLENILDWSTSEKVIKGGGRVGDWLSHLAKRETMTARRALLHAPDISDTQRAMLLRTLNSILPRPAGTSGPSWLAGDTPASPTAGDPTRTP